MVNKIRTFSFCMIIISVCLVSGCTFRYTVPDFSIQSQGGEYSNTNKFNLNVNLLLSEKLRACKWERKKMGDTFLIEIGDQLAKNAFEISELLYRNIEITTSPNQKNIGQIDAILTPTVLVVERTMGATSLGESIFTIVMEWRLEDTDKNIIWVDSIKGEGREKTGNNFNHKKLVSKQIEKLLKDLFSKSFSAMKESPEIRHFALQK